MGDRPGTSNTHVFPTEEALTLDAVNVGYHVETSDERPLLLGSNRYVDALVEQIRPTMTALERLDEVRRVEECGSLCLRNDVFMKRQMGFAGTAAIHASAREVLLEDTAHHDSKGLEGRAAKEDWTTTECG